MKLRILLAIFTVFLLLCKTAFSQSNETSLSLGSEIKVKSTMVFAYTQNYNKPRQHQDLYTFIDDTDSDNVYLYNGRAGSLRMTYSALQLGKEARKGRIGFNVTILDGEADTAYTRISVNSNIVQDAYLIIPVQKQGRSHVFEIGGFVSPLGYEKPQMDNLISRSYQYQFTQPFSLFGLRTNYRDEWHLYYLLQFDGVFDYIDVDIAQQRGLLVQKNVKFSDKKSLTLSALIGSFPYNFSVGLSENFAGMDNGGVFPRISNPKYHSGIINSIYTIQKDKNTQLLVDATINTQETDTGKQTRAAVGGYCQKTQKNGDVVTLRGEYVNRGYNQWNRGIRSLTTAYRWNKSLIPYATTVLELRLDKANAPLFFQGQTRSRRDQTTLAISQVVKF
jgi:hypothetical protein